MLFADSASAHSAVPSADKNTLRRVIDFVRETSDDNLRDVNRKLQRVLEETLTKNMHMQKVTYILYSTGRYSYSYLVTYLLAYLFIYIFPYLFTALRIGPIALPCLRS